MAFFREKMKNDVIYDDIISQNGDNFNFFLQNFLTTYDNDGMYQK